MPDFHVPPGDPEWVLALRRQISDGGAQAPPDILGPVSVLRELRHVCDAVLGARGRPHGEDPGSLVVDIGRSHGKIGEQLREAGGALLEDFTRELGLVKARLASPQGARVIALQVDRLLQRWAEPEPLQAAWRDTQAAFRDSTEMAEMCELRLLQLRELGEWRGHDFKKFGGLATRLEGLLADRPDAIAQRGETLAPGIDPLGNFAGLGYERRLDLCHTMLADRPLVDDVAVWFALGSAALDHGWLRRGPVQFFDGTLVPDHLGVDGPLRGFEGYEPPPELSDEQEAESWLSGFSDQHVVLARIWLPAGPVDTATRRARDLLEGILEVAKADSRWILYEGEKQWRAGGGWSGSMHFRDPASSREVRLSVVPRFEGTAEALSALEGEFVSRLAVGDSKALEAVEDARWTVAVEKGSSAAQRLALATRVLERTLNVARVGTEDWSKPTTRYLLAPWIRFQLRVGLEDAGYAARWGARYRGDLEAFGRAEDIAWKKTGAGQQEMTLDGLSRLQPELGNVLPEGSYEHRLLDDATRLLASSEALRERIVELRARFERLLARTRRQRNAVIHGTRTVPGVLASVDEFAQDLGRLAAQERMRTAETGSDPLVLLERWRTELKDDEARLGMGEDPVSVLRRRDGSG